MGRWRGLTIIEPQAAALAAIRANDGNLMQIRASFSRLLEHEPDTGRPTLNNEADIEFHKSILKACGNLFLAQFGSAIQGALHHTIYLSKKIHMDHKSSYECHGDILTGIENRNPELAYRGMCSVLSLAIADLKLKIPSVILSGRNRMVGAES